MVEPFVFLFGLAIAAFIGLMVLSFYQAKKRREALSRWASSHGLSFDPGTDDTMEDRYPDFACLRKGRNRYAYNIMRGEMHHCRICAFDYHYETESTDSKGKRTTHNYYFSAVIVETRLPLKPLQIRGETFFDKIGDFFGFEDIDFESAEFSRQFRVTSPDRRWAYDVLPQTTIEFLLNAPRFAMEIHNGCILAQNNQTLTPDVFDSALGVVFGFLDRIPPSVLRELQEVNR